MGNSGQPYPTMEEISPDCHALRIVSPAYAGREGELTAILQYVYQAVILDACGKSDESKLLRRIAVQEMRHLEILGTLICKLGAPPVFTACPPYPVSFYSASCVAYVKQFPEMIEADITSERAAIEGYRRMLRCLRNEYVVPVIERILSDEYEHLETFEKLQRNIC